MRRARFIDLSITNTRLFAARCIMDNSRDHIHYSATINVCKANYLMIIRNLALYLFVSLMIIVIAYLMMEEMMIDTLT